jgi:ABC-type branched-subunit amino acid transport system ATPase component
MSVRAPIAQGQPQTAAVPALEVSSVTRSFGGLVAVKSVSMTVGQGEMVALIGPNGAGKSTLFEVISGGYRPDSGDIRFFGRDVTRLPPHRRRRLGLCRTYQKVRLFDQMTVEQNVAIAAMECARPDVPWQDDVAAVLGDLQLTALATRYPSEITLADRKKVEIARASVGACRLLMLDESLCGLTNDEMAEVTAMIRMLNQSKGVTVILVEHVMAVVMALAQRLVVLDYGSVIARGTPAEIARNPAVISAYLGTKHGIKVA